jgi:hypothetical protein
LIPNEKLKYAQVIKNREGGKLKEVIKKAIFGKDIKAHPYLYKPYQAIEFNFAARQ